MRWKQGQFLISVLLLLHPLSAAAQKQGSARVRGLGLENSYNATCLKMDIIPSGAAMGESLSLYFGTDITSSDPTTVFKEFPGVRAAVYYNMLLSHRQTPKGNHFGFLAGPGIVTGASRNEDKEFIAPFLGLSFSAVGFYGFKDSPLVFDVSLKPLFAMYWDPFDKTIEQGSIALSTMKPFTRGMFCSILPSVGVMYNFPAPGFKYDPFDNPKTNYRPVRIGLESSILVSAATYYERHYRTFDGAKTSESGGGFSGQLARELLLGVSMKVADEALVSFFTGYNFNNDYNFVPLYLRYSANIFSHQNDVFGYSSNVFAQVGTDVESLAGKIHRGMYDGKPSIYDNIDLSARIGYAYRFGISDQLRAIFSVFYNCLYNHPYFQDASLVTGYIVPDENILLNFAVHHQIGFGLLIAY